MAKGQVVKIIRYISLIAIIVLSSFSIVPSASATTTTAALPILSEIYPNAPGQSESGFEFIELFNPSVFDIDLSEYVIQIKDKPNKVMPLGGVITGQTYKAFITTFSLVNSGESVQIVHLGEVIQEFTYGAGAQEDESWSYFESGWELAPVTKDLPNQKYTSPDPDPELIDLCPVTPEIDIELPVGYEIDANGNCVLITDTTPVCKLIITEISSQPNHSSQEYVELFNPTDTPASSEYCKLKINGGSERSIPLKTLQPGDYLLVLFSSGVIRNSSGEVVLLGPLNDLHYAYPASNLGESINFDLEGNATISSTPTPGVINQMQVTEEVPGRGSGSELADCGPGKFRNPETNRCKNIESSESNLTPCNEGQERNPETNRCRKIASTASTLTPCNEGQERNPATNRCRKIGSDESTLKPCEPGQERNPETNRCRKIATAVSGGPLAASENAASINPFKYKTPVIILVLVSAIGYGVYEYRSDLKKRYLLAREKISMRRRRD